MADAFVSEIRIVGFNFPPTGWAFCSGQLMPISQNTALFSLLGTTYGGDGKSTFALPNFEGQAPMFFGQGAGLTERFEGEASGSSTVTLLQTEIPIHNHTIGVVQDLANSGGIPGPQSNLAIANIATYNPGPPSALMSPLELSIAGSSIPHRNRQPYLALTFVIALQGIFPQRP